MFLPRDLNLVGTATGFNNKQVQVPLVYENLATSASTISAFSAVITYDTGVFTAISGALTSSQLHASVPLLSSTFSISGSGSVSGTTCTLIISGFAGSTIPTVPSGGIGDLIWLTLTTKTTGTLGTADVISLQAQDTPGTHKTQFFEQNQSSPDTLSPAPVNNSNSSAADPVDTVFNLANKALGVPTFQVNDGTTQRSMVQSLTVTFGGTSNSTTVNFGTATGTDPSVAFVLTDVTTGQVVNPSLLTFSVGNDPNTGAVTVTVTFTDASFVNGSLADGRYALEVLNQKVFLNGQHPYGNDQVYNFFRMYGDAYGLGSVDGRDMAVFNAIYGKGNFDAAFLPYLDYDGNGFIDSSDLSQIRSRFGHHI
jgi:hypothetical protein